MSKAIGDTLPDDLLAELDGEELEGKIGPAYLLVSADEDGTPRPCMLSAGEVLAPDERRIRFALWAGTRTTANLERGGRVLFCHVAPGSVVYVRGETRRLAVEPGVNLACFELGIDSVESDDHAGMPVTSGISFTVERRDPAAVAETWRRQIDALRAATP